MRIPKTGDMWRNHYMATLFLSSDPSLGSFQIPSMTLLLILDPNEKGHAKVYCNGRVGYFWRKNLKYFEFVCSG